MFQRLIDDIKQTVGNALRLTSLASVVAVALFITISFLCAAAFVFALQNYGPVQACLAGATLFFVVTLIAAACYVVRRNQIKEQMKARAVENAKSTVQTAFTDPMTLALGLQVIRAIGVRRLVPLLAVGGLAFGLLASRGNSKAETRKANPEA